MSYISNSINRVKELTEIAINESEKREKNNPISHMILDIKNELVNISMALKAHERLDKRLHAFDFDKHNKLLDLLYE
jgi:phage terminase small subunit